MLNLPALLKNKNTWIGPSPWKWSVLQNPDRERTNQSTGICLGLDLPYNKCCSSPFCECGIDIESVKHFFLFCPRYAAQRNRPLLTSAANILGGTWSSSSDVVSFAAVFRGVTQHSPERKLSKGSFRGSVAWHPERWLRRRLAAMLRNLIFFCTALNLQIMISTVLFFAKSTLL